MRIDLNCDLGEHGPADADLMALITSANVACGAHAGDMNTMRRTAELAQQHRVALGAHPGFADREYFGRRELQLPREQLVRLVRDQVDALRAVASLVHVKPHGGLYTLATRDPATADAIAEAVSQVDPGLRLIGASGGHLVRAGQRWGLPVASEVFADRAYQADGQLVPRSAAGAMITDVEAAAAQVLRMLREGVVRAVDGSDVPVQPDTLCIHGDQPRALEFARRLRAELADAGIAVKRLDE